MDLTFFVDFRCGKYDFMCCLGSYENFILARDTFKGMTDGDVATFHQLCECRPAGGKETPGTEVNCVQKGVEWLCSGSTLTGMKFLQGVLGTMALGSLVVAPELVAFMTMTKSMVDLALDACKDPTNAKVVSAMNAACSVYGTYNNLKGMTGLPDMVKAVLETLTAYIFGGAAGTLAFQAIKAALDACCPTSPVPQLPATPGTPALPQFPGVPGGSAAPYPILFPVPPGMPSLPPPPPPPPQLTPGLASFPVQPSISTPPGPQAYVVQNRPTGASSARMARTAPIGNIIHIPELMKPGMRVK